MKFSLGDWVGYIDNDKLYVGRVRKIEIRDDGVKVYIATSPNVCWISFDEKELFKMSVERMDDEKELFKMSVERMGDDS